MAEFRQRREQQLQEQVGRMRKGILDEIKTVVEAKAKDENYDLRFRQVRHRVCNGVPFLLHSKDAIDFSRGGADRPEQGRSQGGAKTPAGAVPPR